MLRMLELLLQVQTTAFTPNRSGAYYNSFANLSNRESKNASIILHSTLYLTHYLARNSTGCP